MKIQEEFVSFKVGQIRIRNATNIANYRIKLDFFDGVERIVDFEPFLKNSNHPEIRKYLDLDQFNKYEIVNGNLNWNDFDMIFPVSDLYDGKIS